MFCLEQGDDDSFNSDDNLQQQSPTKVLFNGRNQDKNSLSPAKEVHQAPPETKDLDLDFEVQFFLGQVVKLYNNYGIYYKKYDNPQLSQLYFKEAYDLVDTLSSNQHVMSSALLFCGPGAPRRL